MSHTKHQRGTRKTPSAILSSRSLQERCTFLLVNVLNKRQRSRLKEEKKSPPLIPLLFKIHPHTPSARISGSPSVPAGLREFRAAFSVQSQHTPEGFEVIRWPHPDASLWTPRVRLGEQAPSCAEKQQPRMDELVILQVKVRGKGKKRKRKKRRSQEADRTRAGLYPRGMLWDVPFLTQAKGTLGNGTGRRRRRGSEAGEWPAERPQRADCPRCWRF